MTLQVGGFSNPQKVRDIAIFSIESYDSDGVLIDSSAEGGPGSFTIAMKTVGQLRSVEVYPKSLVNGATTQYNFKIIPGLKLTKGDKLLITFPYEVSLPLSHKLNCTGDSAVSISSCIKSKDKELQITLRSISSNYQKWQPFNVFVEDIVNPVSFKPSSPFKDIRLVSAFNFDIAEYENSNLII